VACARYLIRHRIASARTLAVMGTSAGGIFAGHGMGSTVTQRIAMSADIYAFLLWQMGKAQLKN